MNGICWFCRRIAPSNAGLEPWYGRSQAVIWALMSRNMDARGREYGRLRGCFVRHFRSPMRRWTLCYFIRSGGYIFTFSGCRTEMVYSAFSLSFGVIFFRILILSGRFFCFSLVARSVVWGIELLKQHLLRGNMFFNMEIYLCSLKKGRSFASLSWKQSFYLKKTNTYWKLRSRPFVKRACFFLPPCHVPHFFATGRLLLRQISLLIHF